VPCSGYVAQVEQLSETHHTRTDIGTAVGILMERYGIDRYRAFAFLTRNSSAREIKVRNLAKQVIDGTFQSTPLEDSESQEWP
jgi:AmiR/NasT family two-component response regulator